MRHEKEFAARIDYMHLNPVKKGLVSKPEPWRRCSYNNLVLEKEPVRRCPLQVD